MNHTSNITRKDLAFGLFTTMMNTKFYLILMLLFAFIGNYLRVDNYEYNVLTYILSILFDFIILVIMLFFISILQAIFVPLLTKGVLGKHQFVFQNENFTESTEYNETSMKYSAVYKVFTQNGNIYILLSGFHTHILPKRDFNSEEDRVALLKLLYDKSKEYDFIFKTDLILRW